MNEKMKIADFYKKCEDILDSKTEYKEQVLYTKYDRETGEPYKIATRASRWGGREPGNGRFPGRGLIRVFGAQIHVSLSNPPMNGIFNSMEDALAGLEKIMGTVKKVPVVGDEIDVYIMEEFVGKGIIIEDYNEDQWIVEVEISDSSGNKHKAKRYIDKEA